MPQYTQVTDLIKWGMSIVLYSIEKGSIHRYIGCLHEIEIQTFKKYGEQNRLDTI